MLHFLKDTSAAIRTEALLLRKSQDQDLGASLASTYDSAATLVEDFIGRMRSAEASGTRTAVGLAELANEQARPLRREADRLTREADAIADRLTGDVDAAIATLKRPAATDAERASLLDRQRRLEAEDPIIREAFLKEAARVGQDDLLRAALTYPSPPLQIEGARWQPLLRPELLSELRGLISERISPQGELAWRAAYLRGLAAHLRGALNDQA